MRFHCTLLTVLGFGAGALFAGCGSEEAGKSPTTASGGTLTTGGQAPVATGGSNASGGQTSVGGRGGTSATGATSGVPATGGTGTAGKGSGGTSVTGGTSGAGGAAAGSGNGGTGTMTGGAGAGGTATGGSGGALGGNSGAWKCPTGLTGRPTLAGKTPARVASVPPSDAFNMNNGTFGNIEGPLWLGGALYMTEMGAEGYEGLGSEVKRARILKMDASEATSVFIADSGSNGLATDDAGNIVAAVHKDGSITRFTLPGGAPTPLATAYMNARFNSPNDLAIRSDGNLYFSDPSFQAPSSPPQAMTRVYRRAPDGAITAIPDNLSNPNGVTLSLAEDFLYVAAGTGKRFPIAADGSVGAGQDYMPTSSGDGMVIDCAGNLYVAKANTGNVDVYDPTGASIGTITAMNIQAVTNVAFGGAERKTLYITGLGNNKGLFKVDLDIPGRPY